MTWRSEGQRLLAGILERFKQLDVAKACDVEPSTVCRWRSGELTPQKYAHRLALVAFGIPMDTWDRAATVEVAPAA